MIFYFKRSIFLCSKFTARCLCVLSLLSFFPVQPPSREDVYYEETVMPPKEKSKYGKKWRHDQNQAAKRERNWTDLETEAFCEILVDGEFSFSVTLETMALKKQKNREVFEDIQKHLKTAFDDPAFVEENSTYFEESQQKELDISIEKLRNKYHNLKKSWRQIVDRAKVGSGLHVEREPKWFQILHPVDFFHI